VSNEGPNQFGYFFVSLKLINAKFLESVKQMDAEETANTELLSRATTDKLVVVLYVCTIS
jgi:hypothetical protein